MLVLEIEAMCPDDAPEMLAIAREWGRETWTITQGAHGIVVRDRPLGTLLGFALIREQPYGFVVDEIFCRRGEAGMRALSALVQHMEMRVTQIARERGFPLSLGGIVRVENPAMDAAMAERGYNVIAHVRAKEFAP